MHHAARMSDEHLSELVAAFAAQLGAAGFALRELVVSKGDSPHYRSQPHVVVYNAPSSPSTGTRKRPREGPSAAPTLQIVRRKQAPQQQQLHSHAAQDVATVVSEGAALAPTGAVRQQPSPHVQQMVAPPAHHAYYAGAPYYQLAALPHAPMIRPYPLAGPQNMYWSTVLNNGGAPAAPAQPSPSAPPPQATPSAVPRAISAQLPCPRCDAKFGQKSNLNKHIRTVHENRRPFVCDRCPSTFGHKNLLVEHVRTAHDGERPFVCDQCGVSFGRRSNKYQHVQMVHIKRRSFQCQICAMTFGLKGNLSKHVSSGRATLTPRPPLADPSSAAAPRCVSYTRSSDRTHATYAIRVSD